MSLRRSRTVPVLSRAVDGTLQCTIDSSLQFDQLTPPISTSDHLSKTDLHGGKGKERV
ncbi:hypothetical protein PSAB6_390048 [Paraburkholderia sabiae]|nr:hypothetical protein PSAB6_390048 [Paraburkholderia sabiae]